MPIQVVEHEWYLHLLLSGSIERADSWAVVERVRAHAPGCLRVLLDYTGTEALSLSVNELVTLVQNLVPGMERVAIAASQPVIFGLHRQALQLADVGEGTKVRVFRDTDSAREWLLAA